MNSKTELKEDLKSALHQETAQKVLDQIAEIRLKASTIADKQLCVDFKNYCDHKTIDYLIRIQTG